MGTMEVEYKGDMLFEVKAGNHTIKIDVPDSMGGKDRSMTPPQFMLASLASCAAAFGGKYCETAGLDATGMKVTLEYEKLPDPARFTNFKIKVYLPNVHDDKRKNAILKSIVHCPVKASFEAYQGVDIDIEFGN
ncbi:MAG: OsmC family protein [Nanoarchaeota archaeon]|nr:OsmC family protein [Nanoarchaeota archaeon]